MIVYILQKLVHITQTTVHTLQTEGYRLQSTYPILQSTSQPKMSRLCVRLCLPGLAVTLLLLTLRLKLVDRRLANIIWREEGEQVLSQLKDTARYTGLLLAPAEGFGPGFFALLAKKELIMLFWPIFGDFWCPVVTLVSFISKRRAKTENPLPFFPFRES